MERSENAKVLGKRINYVNQKVKSGVLKTDLASDYSLDGDHLPGSMELQYFSG